MIQSAIAAIAGFIKLALMALGLIRDDRLRQEGAVQADLARRDATDAAVQKAQVIEERPQPKTLQDSLKRLAVAGLMLALSGCAMLTGDTLTIKADVDCPVLGKQIKMADDAKAWLLAQPSPPDSLLTFTNAVGTHNEKVAEICRKAPG